MNKKTFSLLRGALFLAAISPHVLGQVILIGNYPPSNDFGGNSISSSISRAVSFTMPSQSYNVTSVDLRLFNYTTADNASVGIYPDDGGSPGLPGSTPIAIMNDAPTSSDFNTATFTFTAPGTVTLSANTTYWLVVKDDVTDVFTWIASTADTPNHTRAPDGLATFGSYHVASSGVWNPANNSSFNTFQINATAVPEPSQYAAAGAGALFVFAAVRRYLRKAA